MDRSPRQLRRRRKASKRATAHPAILKAEPDKQSRKFTEKQKRHALTLIAAGMMYEKAAAAVGASTQSLYRWRSEAKARGTMPLASGEPKSKVSNPSESETQQRKALYEPRDPGQGLSDPEVAAILELKKSHPSMGPAQLRAQLKRFKGWRLSIKAIARVLRMHGYELVHRGSRPKGDEPVRFEAPRRNALWQADFAEVRVHSERLHVIVIIDDFSRFVVGFTLSDGPTSKIATETLKAAIARHGKPEAVRTDRGSAFVAASKEEDFARYLEAELIDHIRGRAYHPQGGGKVEATIKTLRRELWDIGEFADRHEAQRKLVIFFEEYNHLRAHMGIDGLTPADRFFGRGDRVLAAIDGLSRKRQGVLDLRSPNGPIEELFGPATGAPMEVLRLIIVDGVMELRFCGARIRLGPVEI